MKGYKNISISGVDDYMIKERTEMENRKMVNAELQDIQIKDTELPHWIKNALVRKGINSVKQLYKLSNEHIVSCIGVYGERKVREYLDNLSEKITQGAEERVSNDPQQESENKKELREWVAAEEIDHNDGTLLKVLYPNAVKYAELSINKLKLSKRANNCFHRTGIKTVGELLELSIEDLYEIRSMGQTTVQIIEECIKKLSDGEPGVIQEEKENNWNCISDTELQEGDISIERMNLSVRSYNILRLNGIHYLSQILKYPDIAELRNCGTKSAEEIMNAAKYYYDKYGCSQKDEEDLKQKICRKVRKGCLRLLESQEEGIEHNELIKSLAYISEDEKQIEEAIRELEEENKIYSENGILKRKYLSVLDYAEQIENEKYKGILLSRLNGKTLEEAGAIFEITRERARQITGKVLKNHPEFREDKYRYLVDNYSISRDEFLVAFEDEPESTVNYLWMIRDTKEQKSLHKALSDQNISVKMKKMIEKVLYKNFVIIDGSRVLKQRSELVRFAVKRYCKDTIEYKGFVKKYQTMLEELNLHEEKHLQINEGTYGNKLNSSSYVLWNFKKRMRYYDIENQDMEELFSAIDLNRYEDIELSTLKWFRDYPQIMKAYDIRDEYELHNLMKKTIDAEKYPTVSFNKMPTVFIGTPDRNEQMFELLVRYAPISRDDLAEMYEKEYGVKKETCIGSYMDCLEAYRFGDMYIKEESKKLPEDVQARLRQILSENYYTLKKIRALYMIEYPEGKATDINPYTLKELGFRIYSEFALKTEAGTAKRYFERILTEKDIVNTEELDFDLRHEVQFYQTVYELKEKREIIEFSPKQYIHIRKLEANGIGKAELQEYCDAVYSKVSEGEFFTIYSLRENGFSHPLEELGFDDWFYSSILAEDPRFSYRRAGGRRLLCCGEKQISIRDLVESIVERKKKIEIEDLLALLEKEYGLKLNIWNMVNQTIANTDLYYDEIMETVYVDYDTYFEEV